MKEQHEAREAPTESLDLWFVSNHGVPEIN